MQVGGHIPHNSTDVLIYVMVGDQPYQGRFYSVDELEAFAATAPAPITGIQYAVLTPGTTQPITYAFHRTGGAFAASGTVGFDGESVEVPAWLVTAIEPLTFVESAPIGVLVEYERGSVSIKLYGVAEPLAALKSILQVATAD